MEQPLTKCKNCQRSYVLSAGEAKKASRFPLLLTCGHTLCSVCVAEMKHRMQAHSGALSCPECKATTRLTEEQLPVNVYLLGMLSAQVLGLSTPMVYFSKAAQLMRDSLPPQHLWRPMLDSELLQPDGGTCSECEINTPTLHCARCEGVYCRECFTLVHATSKSLRRHVGAPITSLSYTACPAHPGEKLKMYCREDGEAVCSDCCVVGGHVGHHVVPLSDAAQVLRDDLKPAVTKSKIALKKMQKAQKELRGKLPRQCPTRVRLLCDSFMHLASSLQLRQQSLLRELVRNCEMEVDPIREAYECIQGNVDELERTLVAIPVLMKSDITLVKEGPEVLSELAKVEEMMKRKELKHNEIKISLDMKAAVEQIETFGEVTTSVVAGGDSGTGSEEYNSDSSDQHLSVLYRQSCTPSSSPCPPPPPFSTPHFLTPSPRGAGKHQQRMRSRSRSPQPFLLKETELVCVTHIESPSELYVQKSHSLNEMFLVMKSLSTFCQEPALLDRNCFQAGTECACLYHEDRVWYRAVIDSVSQHSGTTYFDVTYIDFGNSEQVTLSNLRPLPDSCSSYPPFCVKCALGGIRPPRDAAHHTVPSGRWPTNSTTVLQALVCNRDDVRMKVCVPDTSPLQVDLYLPSPSGLESVSHKLVEQGVAVAHERKRGVRGKHPPPSSPLPAPGMTVRAEVSTVNNPHNFYVQLESNKNVLGHLCSAVKLAVDMGGLTPPSVVEKGLVCLALYNTDGLWYRAEVKSVDRDRATVYFIDYGNTEVVNVKKILELSDELLDVPKQAMLCMVSRIESCDSSGIWLEEVNDEFHEITDSVTSIKVVDIGSQPVPVDLKNEKGNDIAQIMVQSGLAKWSAPETPPSTPLSETPSCPRIPDPAIPEGEGAVHMYPVQVLQMTSPASFHVQIFNEEAKALVDGLAKQAAVCLLTAPPPPGGSSTSPVSPEKRKWKVGDYALAEYNDRMLHRVRVEVLLNYDLVEVYYVDYGNKECVDSHSLFPLPLSLSAFPAQVFCCKLAGVTPVPVADKKEGMAGVWSKDSVYAFTEIVASNKKLCMKLQDVASSPVTVSLSSDGKDVGELLRERGFAV